MVKKLKFLFLSINPNIIVSLNYFDYFKKGGIVLKLIWQGRLKLSQSGWARPKIILWFVKTGWANLQ